MAERRCQRCKLRYIQYRGLCRTCEREMVAERRNRPAAPVLPVVESPIEPPPRPVYVIGGVTYEVVWPLGRVK